MIKTNLIATTVVVPLVPPPPGAPATQDFNSYAAGIFNYAIVIAATLAVVMIAWGGLEYMFSQVPGIKSESKGRIWAAVGGLLLLLASWLILDTINPQITGVWKGSFQQIINKTGTPTP